MQVSSLFKSKFKVDSVCNWYAIKVSVSILRRHFGNLCLVGKRNAILMSLNHRQIDLYGFSLKLNLDNTGLDHHEQGRWQSLFINVPTIPYMSLTGYGFSRPRPETPAILSALFINVRTGRPSRC